MKPCSTCHEEKPLTDYYKSVTGQDGHRAKCKTCCRKIHDIWRAKNKESIKEYDRQRAKLPHRKKARDRRSVAWIKKHPLKFKARCAARYAIKTGRLVKPDTCEICKEKSSQIEGHHEDYTKPWDVIWLCFTCHRRLHGDDIKVKKQGGDLVE